MTDLDYDVDVADLPRPEEEFEALTLSPPVPLEEEIIARASANHEPLPMLDVIFSRLATAYSTMLKSQNGFLSETGEPEISYTSWGQTIEGLDANGLSGMARSSWGGSIAIAMDPALLHALMTKLMGGTPSVADTHRRPPTALEKAFGQRLMVQTLTELSQHFSRITEVSFALEGVEAPAQLSSFLAANAMVAQCSLSVEIGGVEGRLSLILPMQTLEPVRAHLAKMFLGEKLGVDTGWREHFAHHITGSTMQLSIELHKMSVPLLEVLDWRPGKVLDLGIDTDHEATVICSGHRILHGVTGRKRNGRAALRITREASEATQEAGDDDLLMD